MRVVLTFDVEVWCKSWKSLDMDFPKAFSRYVYGRSKAGDYALPHTLKILKRNNLKCVFFVEPLFAARFGRKYLDTIVMLIREAGHDVQLHLHPEWADEIYPPPLPDIPGKRQHLCHYSQDEQIWLIALGKDLLQQAGGAPPTAFRAGSFAANRDTFVALAKNGILQDSSIDATRPYSVADMREFLNVQPHSKIGAVEVYPLSVFRDGIGRLRQAQIGACSAAELVQAMYRAQKIGWSHFVVLSHNFEMLKPGLTDPDWIVVHRFEQICSFLGRHKDSFSVGNFDGVKSDASSAPIAMPQVGLTATGRRYAEQALRRVM
jgi:hypothetical protein